MANPPHVAGSIPDQNIKIVTSQQGTPDMTPDGAPQPTPIISADRLGITPGGRTINAKKHSRRVLRTSGLGSEKRYTPN